MGLPPKYTLSKKKLCVIKHKKTVRVDLRIIFVFLRRLKKIFFFFVIYVSMKKLVKIVYFRISIFYLINYCMRLKRNCTRKCYLILHRRCERDVWGGWAADLNIPLEEHNRNVEQLKINELKDELCSIIFFLLSPSYWKSFH